MKIASKPGKQDWYFTFGRGDEHNGEPYRDKFVKIHGTFEGARLEMFMRYGRAWSMQHESAAAAGVKTFKLEEV